MLDIKTLTPEDLIQLKQLLGLPEMDQRSAAWKPLADLRNPISQKKRLYRPHFEWSAEDDGLQVINEFPRWYWDEQGVERRVDSADVMIPATWMPHPPGKAAPVDPMIRIQAEFDALSPDEQQFVLHAQKQARLSRLNDLMAGVPDVDLDALARKSVKTAAKKSA